MKYVIKIYSYYYRTTNEYPYEEEIVLTTKDKAKRYDTYDKAEQVRHRLFPISAQIEEVEE